MKVLVACEYSGIVRDAFAAKGNDAWSCDILDTESKGQHIKGDVLEHLDDDELYDLVDKVKNILSDDGVFIIKTINAESLIDIFI